MLNNSSNIAIIGASGALGQAFTTQLAQLPHVKSIFAFSRSKMSFDNEKIITDYIDVTDEKSIESCSLKASSAAKIDLVIVAIGMLHNDEIMPEKSLKELSVEKFNHLFAINTIAPALIAKHFLPQLSKDNPAIFAALSARVGSISDNRLGGWYAYRASKAALNMILKNSAIEINRSNKNAIVVGLHPGTVASKLSQPFQSAVPQDKLFTPDFSATKLLNVLDTLSSTDSGNLFDFNGIKIEF